MKTTKVLNEKKISVFYSKKWRAARDPKQRVQSRHELQTHLNRKQTESPLKYASISHAPQVGGYAVCSHQVGFDLEACRRTVNLRTASRFAKASELKIVGDPLHLWVMKEAAWKALRGPRQPLTITKVTITDCKTLPRKQGLEFRFSAKIRQNKRTHGFGLLWVKHNIVFALGLA